MLISTYPLENVVYYFHEFSHSRFMASHWIAEMMRMTHILVLYMRRERARASDTRLSHTQCMYWFVHLFMHGHLYNTQYIYVFVYRCWLAVLLVSIAYVCHLSLCKHQVPSVIAINGVSHFGIFRLCGFVYMIFPFYWIVKCVMTTVQPIYTRYLMSNQTYIVTPYSIHRHTNTQ